MEKIKQFAWLKKLLLFFLNQVTGSARRFNIFSRRKNGKKTGSMVRRFQSLLLAWGILVYVTAASGFWFISSYTIQSTFEQQSAVWMNQLDKMSANLYGSDRTVFASEIEAYASSFSEIAYVRVYMPDGKTLSIEYTSDGEEKINIAGLPSNIMGPAVSRRVISSELSTDKSLMRMTSPFYTINEPVITELSALGDENQSSILSQKSLQRETVNKTPKILGYIDMGLDFSVYQDRLVVNIIYGTLFILFFFLLAAIAGRHLIRKALRPLLDLREPLNRLAQGDTDVWVSKEGDEEIVAISNALNTTIRAIKGRDDELRRLADYDALTGLINKRSFNVLLEKERRRILLEKDCSALLFIDLDQFKYVNDTLGHASGDRLLVQIAELLNKRMRNDDVVCRLGGDEFAVLAKSVDKEGAIEIANALVKSMYDFLFIEQGKTFNIYCSVGVALIEDNKFNAEDIFSNADMACYKAKSMGRNRFHLYQSEEVDKNRMDIGWSHRIAEALANDDFVLHFQPIIGEDKTEAPGYEVLIRMKDNSKNGQDLVQPNMFIPIAERFGLATEIDYWVIENSMKVLEEMNDQNRPIRLYINLSGQLLVDPEFVERVVGFLMEYRVSAEQMVFELTERAAVGNVHNACIKMQKLQSYGFRFAVDDFGSGFSSFSYIKNMPVEFVKIEGEFVERIMHDEVDRALVKSMIDIAKACGKKVVAEYVCDQKTYDLLKSYGIDYAQGYFLAEPSAELVERESSVSYPGNVVQLNR